jgi:Concanavalin A-like lectin/glucanases superfamily/Fibronectin type III domain
MRRLIPVMLMLAGCAVSARAQTIVDPGRRIDWSQAGVPGGLPNRTTICATLNPGATAAQINSAIAACTNGVVVLNAGTYSLSTGLNFSGSSNVTLRGAGPRQTILQFTGADGCGGFPASVCLKGSSSVGVWGVPAANVHNWTAGYAKGTAQITLDSVSGMSVGMILALDQIDDTADTGGVVVNGQSASAFSIEGAAPGRPNRTQVQYVKVTAINGTQVTISPGLYMPNWRSSQSPQAWFWGTVSQTAVAIGIENLTLDHSTNTAEQTGLMIWNAYGCWVKNVRSISPNRNHVWLYQSAHSEVRDSYFYGTKNAASQSYGVESFMTGDNLIINNIFQHVTTPMMTGTSSGNVTAYNYAIDMFYSVVMNWEMHAINASHDTGTGMNLFEGNETNSLGMDLYHGPGAYPTAFRNYLTGRDGTRTSNSEVVAVWAYNRFVNLVGNVLGTPGYHIVYEDSQGPQGRTGNPNQSIYLLGYSGVDESSNTGIAYDLKTVTTMLRWGNFDYATNTTRWNASELPSDNPVPSTQTLPPSLFLSAKPGWWGTMAWPAIGPDVTGGYDQAGHVQKNPAHVCFDSSAKNADGSLVFDAAQCYTAGPPDTTKPTTPTNVAATAVSSSQITVTWTASSDNVGVTGYRILRCQGAGCSPAVQVGTAPGTSYSDTNLSASSSYTYVVSAVDAAGNVSTASAPATAVTQALPPSTLGLVAGYSFAEGTGATTSDVSPNHNTATLNGAAWTASGKFGSALAFNGASSFVEAPDITALTPQTDATFEAWVLLTATPSETASVINKWSQTADDEYLFGVTPGRTVYLAWQTTGGATWGTGSYNEASGTGQIPLNAFTHIAVVRSGTTLSFYINGSLDAVRTGVTDANPFRGGITTLRLGGQGRGARNRFFTGTIDEVCIYNRALTQQEIQTYMIVALTHRPAPPRNVRIIQ